MKNNVHIPLLFLLVAFSDCLPEALSAQEIPFHPRIISDAVSVRMIPSSLEFGPLPAGSSRKKTICLADPEAVVFMVTAPVDYELTFYAGLPAGLFHETDKNCSLPVDLRFAYSNRKAPDLMTARYEAVEVPGDCTSVTIPVVAGNSGSIRQQSDEDATGSHIREAVCYLFFYGELGPAKTNSAAGSYEAAIYITIDGKRHEE